MNSLRVLFILLSVAVTGCTPQQVLRNDSSVDNRTDSGEDQASDRPDVGSSEPTAVCTGGTIEGSPCTTSAYFNFDDEIGLPAGLQGFSEENTFVHSVSNLRTWCSHRWCGSGAMMFDCQLDERPGNPGLNQCVVQVPSKVPVAGEGGTDGLSPSSKIKFWLRADSVSQDRWMRVYVQVIDSEGWKSFFAGYVNPTGWTAFTVDLAGKPVQAPLGDGNTTGLGIYVDVNDNTAVWSGTIWIDEIGWE